MTRDKETKQNYNLLFNNQKEETLLDKSQMASLLQVSTKTIDKWVCKKQIPFIKLGRSVRFSKAQIESWLKQRSHHVN